MVNLMYSDGGRTVQDNCEDHDSGEYSTTSLAEFLKRKIADHDYQYQRRRDFDDDDDF